MLPADFAGGRPAVCQDCVHRAGGGHRDAARPAAWCSGACSQVCTHHEAGKTPCSTYLGLLTPLQTVHWAADSAAVMVFLRFGFVLFPFLT